MKLLEPTPVTVIAEQFGAELVGDRTIVATGVNEIHKVEPGDITFSDIEKYFNRALQSQASIVILNKTVECPPGKALLICDKPFEVYDGIVRKHKVYREITTDIDPTARIHESVYIEPNVIIGPDVEIGEGSRIETGAIIREGTLIGKRVIIQSRATIGSDAFYFKRENDVYTKWTSGGRVVIGDDVFIGSNCTIVRGVSGETVIGEGTKIDCLVHVGHGAVIGKHCLVAAQVGISGKTIIGDRSKIYGQVGIAHGLNIGTDVVILAKSGVQSNIEKEQTVFGIPAYDARAKWREIALVKKLPEIMKSFNKLVFPNETSE